MEELLNLSSEGRRALVVGRFETLEEWMSLCGNGDELKAQRQRGALEMAVPVSRRLGKGAVVGGQQ